MGIIVIIFAGFEGFCKRLDWYNITYCFVELDLYLTYVEVRENATALVDNPLNIESQRSPVGNQTGQGRTQQPPSKDGGMRRRPPPTESRRNAGASAKTPHLANVGGPSKPTSTSAAKADRLKAGGFNLEMDIKIDRRHLAAAEALRR